MDSFDKANNKLRTLTIILAVSVLPFTNLLGLITCIVVFLGIKKEKISLLKLGNGLTILGVISYAALTLGFVAYGIFLIYKEKSFMFHFFIFIMISIAYSFYAVFLCFYADILNEYIKAIIAKKEEENKVYAGKNVTLNTEEKTLKQNEMTE